MLAIYNIPRYIIICTITWNLMLLNVFCLFDIDINNF